MANLYVVDEGAPYSEVLMTWLAMRGFPVVHVRRRDDMTTIALEIQRTAARHPATHGRIRTLYLMAHGDAGLLRLGRGLTTANAIELAPVHGCLHGGFLSSVCIYGCNVGSAIAADAHGGGSVETPWETPLHAGNVRAGAGYGLLRALAQTLAVRVSAPVIRQNLGPRDYEQLLEGRAYQGPVLTVNPAGHFTIVRTDSHGDIVSHQDSEMDFL
ncbi:MAG TPA: hypothetical protein VN329_12700 [Roseomonas sp.]|nr:hypothetical protein [Roseomonas sp.]